MVRKGHQSMAIFHRPCYCSIRDFANSLLCLNNKRSVAGNKPLPQAGRPFQVPLQKRAAWKNMEPPLCLSFGGLSEKWVTGSLYSCPHCHSVAGALVSLALTLLLSLTAHCSGPQTKGFPKGGLNASEATTRVR